MSNFLSNIVSGLGSLVGDLTGTTQAAQATTNAANTAAGTQTAALQQEANLSAPYRAEGQLALPQVNQLLGLSGGGAAGIESTLQNTPGYQFTQSQGNQGTINAATTSGMNLSGNTLEALDKFNTGLADTTYQQAVNNATGVAGMGQAAAAGQAQNVGSTANNLSTIATNQGTNIANLGMAQNQGVLSLGSSALGSYELSNTLASLGGNAGGVGALSSATASLPTDASVLAAFP